MARSIPALLLLLVGASEAGHADMFSCRRGECAVTELTDANWNTKLAVPHFIMFYAPWCGHCKQLAPKLKDAAKSLADVGVKIGAVDVEPNPQTQAKFPDIRGFPTLKFVVNPGGKKAVDYNGAREADAIVEFAKAESKKAGVVLGEPVPVKVRKRASEARMPRPVSNASARFRCLRKPLSRHRAARVSRLCPSSPPACARARRACP